MISDNIIIQVVFHMIFLVTGSAGSLFILSVQLIDWLKIHKLDPVDLIIISIGFVNLLLQGSLAFNEITVFLFEDFYVQIVNSSIVVMSSLAFSSLWCSTTLCFYYYVKIINLNGTIFYKLKTKLPVFVPWLLVFSNVISWSIGLPAYWDIYKQILPTGNATYLSSTYHFSLKSRCDCLFQIYIAVSAVAFAVIFFTAGSLIKSLYEHVTQFKKNNEDLRHTTLSAHISAARTVLSLLLFHLLFYGMLNIIFNETQDIHGSILNSCFMMSASFPTVNALILIFGNRKLSNKLRYILGVKSSSGNTEVFVTA